MRAKLLPISIAFLLITTLLVNVSARAAEEVPMLVVLQHLAKSARAEVKVKAKPGPAVSPMQGKKMERLRILPGQALAMSRPPADRVIELYQGIEEAQR